MKHISMLCLCLVMAFSSWPHTKGPITTKTPAAGVNSVANTTVYKQKGNLVKVSPHTFIKLQ